MAFVVIRSIYSTHRSLLVMINHTDLRLWLETPLKCGLVYPQSPGSETSCLQDFERWQSELYHKETPVLSDVVSLLVSWRQLHPPTWSWPHVGTSAVYRNLSALGSWGEYTAVTLIFQVWVLIQDWLKERNCVFFFILHGTDFSQNFSWSGEINSA